MSLAQARDRASRELATIRDGGPDMAERRRQTLAAPTVADLIRQFLEVEAPARIARGRMTERTRVEYARQSKAYVLPAIGTMRVAEVKRGHIEHMVASLLPTVRNRVLALASRLFTLAEVWEMRPAGINPVRKIERARETARDRVLSPDEMAALAGALNEAETESPAAVAVIRFLALTGLRVSEALAIQWEHVDLSSGRLLIPESKTGRKWHDVPAPALQTAHVPAPPRAVGLHLHGARANRLQDGAQGVSPCLQASWDRRRENPRFAPWGDIRRRRVWCERRRPATATRTSDSANGAPIRSRASGPRTGGPGAGRGAHGSGNGGQARRGHSASWPMTGVDKACENII